LKREEKANSRENFVPQIKNSVVNLSRFRSRPSLMLKIKFKLQKNNRSVFTVTLKNYLNQ
jgi:hypothetical protein